MTLVLGGSQEAQCCIRVLVADDEESIRGALELVVQVFEDLQLVGVAENGEEAVNLCDQVKPDVVLMDLLMPVMDGLTATRLIRQRYPWIEVVTLSNRCDGEYTRPALEAGAYHCLPKGVTVEEIVETIRSAKAHLGQPPLVH